MGRAVGGILVGLAVAALGPYARADGKFFAEKVPPDLPYQRALLLFHDHTETLMVQSKYDLAPSAQADSIGWVVPVPDVPELASMDTESAWWHFWIASRYTQPRIVSASVVFAGIAVGAFLLSLLWLLLFAGQWTFTKARGLESNACQRRVGLAFATTVFSFFAVAIFLPTLSMSAGVEGVEVVKSLQVGIYDMQVIRGDSADPIMDWLGANGFAVADDDRTAFADYAARRWCFVAARVRSDPNNEARQIAGEALAAPLVLTFATDKPVYPLALTATAGAKTEILLYTVSDTKLTCEGRLRLRAAHPVDSKRVTELFSIRHGSDQWEPVVAVPDRAMTLCKFKGPMTAAQMARDLEFEPAPDNKPYRERKIVW